MISTLLQKIEKQYASDNALALPLSSEQLFNAVCKWIEENVGELAPYIDVNTGNWFVYDVATAQYIDTGTKAKAESGVLAINGLADTVSLLAGDNVTVTTNTEAGTITIGVEPDVVDTVNGVKGEVKIVAGTNVNIETDKVAGTVTIGAQDVDVGVVSINTLAGDISIAAGGNVTVTEDSTTNTITISAIGGSGSSGVTSITAGSTALTGGVVIDGSDTVSVDINEEGTAIVVKLDGTYQSQLEAELERKSWYGTCSTAYNATEKVVVCEGFVLTTGAHIDVKFDNYNTNGAPSLNVNNTGAKTIKSYGTTSGTVSYRWHAGSVVGFTYDGDYWQFDIPSVATSTYYGVSKVATLALNGTATANPTFYAPTSAGTSGYVLTSNGSGAPTWAELTAGGSTVGITVDESGYVDSISVTNDGTTTDGTISSITAEERATLERALVTPITTPSDTVLVGVDTTNAQVLVTNEQKTLYNKVITFINYVSSSSYFYVCNIQMNFVTTESRVPTSASLLYTYFSNVLIPATGTITIDGTEYKVVGVTPISSTSFQVSYISGTGSISTQTGVRPTFVSTPVNYEIATINNWSV